MKKIYFFIVIMLFACVVSGQDRINIDVQYSDDSPAIDGIIDFLWDNIPAVQIEKMFVDEQPSVTAFWKAVWNDDALYVLVSVEDDDHWPFWESGGSWWQYDQAELYLDINEVLEDGIGPGIPPQPNGHYQVQPPFADGGSGVVGSLQASNYRPGGQYCYVLSGEDYVFEYKLDYTSFINKDGIAMDVGAFHALEKIGFDVYVIDADETTGAIRQRAVWQNTGEVIQAYDNMDACGTITLTDEPSSINSVESKAHTLYVYPNPVHDYLTINAEFDKLIIADILGKEIVTIANSDNRISMKSLARGIYFIQAFNKGNSLGVAKIHKM